MFNYSKVTYNEFQGIKSARSNSQAIKSARSNSQGWNVKIFHLAVRLQRYKDYIYSYLTF